MRNGTEKSLLIRCDANERIGMGHLMRCLALAQAWQDSGFGAVHFVVATLPKVLSDRLLEEGMQVHLLEAEEGSNTDAKKTIAIAQEIGVRWMVIDGYHFDVRYEELIKSAGLHLLVLDDGAHADHFSADIVLNQNAHASRALYPTLDYQTRLLMGTRYALLRREFRPWRFWHRTTSEKAHKVLITLGGFDPHHVTLQIVKALAKLPNLEVVVVVNHTAPEFKELRATTDSLGWRVLADVRNMAELMAWADVAISASGSTCWELLFMELPSLVLIMAENQEPIANNLAQAGAVESLGWYSKVSQELISEKIKSLLSDQTRRHKMSQIGRKYIDGVGGERVCSVIQSPDFIIRPVTQSDCRQLWEWANDPVIREASFSSDPISWDQHTHWFSEKLKSPSCYFFIGIDQNDLPVGQIRFEAAGEKAEIHVSVGPSNRGRGFGERLVKLAVEELFRISSIQTVCAFIKPENTLSIKTFEKAGFTCVDQTKHEHAALYYQRQRDEAVVMKGSYED